MITLNTALASGRRFTRSINEEEGYMEAEEFLAGGLTLADYNATDYILEPEVAVNLKMSVLTSAWNSSKPATSVAVAEQSDFFKRFTDRLKGSGISITM